jgi:hypothetical protein
VVWTSLAGATVTATPGGVITALVAGTANVVASTPRIGADSLRDAVRIVVLAPPAAAATT